MLAALALMVQEISPKNVFRDFVLRFSLENVLPPQTEILDPPLLAFAMNAEG